MSKTYLYHVKTPTGEHIVEASSKSVAINHVVRETITANNLTASDLVYLQRTKNLQIETANAEAAEPAAAKTTEANNGNAETA